MSATYHAECWAESKTPDEIREEIQRLDSMWHSKLANPFPRNAHYAYCRLVALQNILKKLLDIV